MNDYGIAGQAESPQVIRRSGLTSPTNNPIPQPPDPQMLSQLGECVRSLRDLRSRMEEINSRLRGQRPECGAEPKEAEPKVPHLAMVLNNFRNLLEQCHAEATEAQAHLS